jgi:hypothetical protein
MISVDTANTATACIIGTFRYFSIESFMVRLGGLPKKSLENRSQWYCTDVLSNHDTPAVEERYLC